MAKKRGQVSLTRRKDTPSVPPKSGSTLSTRETILAESSDLTLKQQSDKVTKGRIAAYVDPDLPLRLTMAQVQVQRLTGMKGHSVSQSVIVETALEIALSALETHGANSELVIELLKKNSDIA